MRKESLINGTKGALPAHPYPSRFERIKGSKVRAQLLLFKNKSEEREEKNEENCRYLLEGLCGRKKSRVCQSWPQSWGAKSRLLLGRLQFWKRRGDRDTELGTCLGDGDGTARSVHGDWLLPHACCTQALPPCSPLNPS